MDIYGVIYRAHHILKGVNIIWRRRQSICVLCAFASFFCAVSNLLGGVIAQKQFQDSRHHTNKYIHTYSHHTLQVSSSCLVEDKAIRVVRRSRTTLMPRAQPKFRGFSSVSWKRGGFRECVCICNVDRACLCAAGKDIIFSTTAFAMVYI